MVTWGRGYNDQKINSKRKGEAKWKRLYNLQKVTLTMRHATFLALPDRVPFPSCLFPVLF